MHEDVTKRMQVRFQVLDQGGKGYLTKDDLRAEAIRILRATHVPETDPRAGFLLSTYEAYWWALLDDLDRNQDGKISFDEYAQAAHANDNVKAFSRIRGEAVDRVADLDRDGWITRDDFRTVELAIGFTEAAAMATFDAMDTAGQGRIPAGRFTEMIVEFFDESATAGAAQRLVPAES